MKKIREFIKNYIKTANAASKSKDYYYYFSLMK